MLRLSMVALLGGLLVLSTGVIGQEKKDDQPVKAKGMLPQNWNKIGLSDDQKQAIYKIEGKYKSEIDKLDAQIKELKGKRDKEMKAVLTEDQKKKLADIVTGK